MAEEVNQGYALSNLQDLSQKHIEFKNADGKVIKISVESFKTEKSRKVLGDFLGHYYDNGDKGSIKKDGKLQSGELENLTKDLTRNHFTNEKGELEITEDTIEKFTYAIEEKGQKPGLREEFRTIPSREREFQGAIIREEISNPEKIRLPSIPKDPMAPPEKSSAWSSKPAKQALKQEILNSAKEKSSLDETNFVKMLEKFIKEEEEEELKEKGQKQNIDDSIPDLKQDKLQDQDKVFILRFMQYLIETTPKYEIKLKFERFQEKLERFKI